MAKVKGLIKKDIREIAQDGIVAGLVFQYRATSVEAIEADAQVSRKDAEAILAEMREQDHRIVKLFGIDPDAFDEMLDAPPDNETPTE